MDSNFCHAVAVGELSFEGRKFLTELSEKGWLTFTEEASPHLLKSPNLLPLLCLIEKCSDSVLTIEVLREKRAAYLIWFGKNFSKEDLAFAIENRIYAVWEYGENSAESTLNKLAKNQHLLQNFSQILQSLKIALLQDSNNEMLLSELKTGLGKLERFAFRNEFCSSTSESSDGKAVGALQHDLVETLLTIQDLDRSGNLWIKGKEGRKEGRIDFIQGQMVSVSAGETKGLKAFFRMFLWENPTCLFSHQTPDKCVVDEPPLQSLKTLCAEGQRQREVFKKVSKDTPPSNLVLQINPENIHTDTKLSKEDFYTLASVVEFGEVGKVLEYNPLDDLTLHQSLINLRKNNFVSVG